QENIGNVIVNGNQVGCSYKEFLACNPKKYDSKGEEFCPSHEMQKLETELWNRAMVGAGHVAYTDRFHELARVVPHLVTPDSTKIEMYVYGLAPQIHGMVAALEPKTIQKAVQISGALTDEARTRTENAFATTANPIARENTSAWPKCTICNSYYAPGGPCRICFNCNRPGHLEKDCRGIPRNVNPVNARNLTVRACYECGSTDHVRSTFPRVNRAHGPKRNRPNQVATNNGGQGHRNQGNQTRGRAFMLGAEKARQDPNIVTRTHRAIELGFRYEIEIASGQLVEINKVGCSYKEFLACNPKKYDSKGEEFCPSHEMQKLETELWNRAMVGAGHVAYTDRFHELARVVPHLVT
nr:hypothetical protein [Tanacetum cinerariifolium]